MVEVKQHIEEVPTPGVALRRAAAKSIPWIITAIALYFAFRDVEWDLLISHLGEADPTLILLSFALTTFSYLIRSRRWQRLFPAPVDGQSKAPLLSFVDSFRVLILGFFMNNILPARAGEFVRAHLGARHAGEKRTLVLATIASERLLDGLTLSLLFVAFSVGIGGSGLSKNLLYVAIVFGAVAIGVVITLAFRAPIFKFLERIKNRFDSKYSRYAYDRAQVFINGLSPLTSPRGLPAIVCWSAVIWTVELAVYLFIARAYNESLSLGVVVLFLVAVNFSSLIPSAPGGIGVIEAIASAVLVSVGVPREKALTMVITQHVIQYLVVGIPGALVMLTWKRELKKLKDEEE